MVFRTQAHAAEYAGARLHTRDDPIGVLATLTNETHRFVSDFERLKIVIPQAPPFEMRRIADYQWQGIVAILNPSDPVTLQFKGRKPRAVEDEPGDTVFWGDAEQWKFDLPTEGIAQPGEECNVRFHNPEAGQQYLVRFNERTGEYLIVAVRFEDFDDWFSGTDRFHVGSKGISSKIFTQNFESWPLSFDTRSQNFSAALWDNARSEDAYFVGDGWAIRGRIAGTPTPKFQTPPDAPALPGWVRPVGAMLLDGVGDMMFDYRAVDTNLYTTLYTNPDALTWTNISVDLKLEATTIGGDATNGLPAEHRVMLRYQDDDNYYWFRIYDDGQRRVSLNRRRTGQHDLLASHEIGGRLTDGGQFRLVTLNENDGVRLQFQMLTNMQWQIPHENLNYLDNDDALRIDGPGFIGLAARETDMIARDFLVHADGANGDPEATTFQVGDWDDPSGIWRLDDGVYSRSAVGDPPAFKVSLVHEDAYHIHDQDEELGYPDPTLWTNMAVVTGVDHVEYQTFSQFIGTNAKKFVVLRQIAGDPGKTMLRFDNIEYNNWAGQTIESFDLSGDPLTVTRRFNTWPETEDYTSSEHNEWTAQDTMIVHDHPQYYARLNNQQSARIISPRFDFEHGISNVVLRIRGAGSGTAEVRIQSSIGGSTWTTEGTPIVITDFSDFVTMTQRVHNSSARYIRVRNERDNAAHLEIERIEIQERVVGQDWLAAQGWVKEWENENEDMERILEFRNSRAIPSDATQYLRSPVTANGAGTIEFEIRNAPDYPKAVSWCLQRASVSQPDQWTTLVTSNTVSAGWTPVSIEIGDTVPRYYRLAHDTPFESGEDAAMWVRNFRITPFTHGEIDENWTVYNVAITGAEWGEDKLFRDQGRSAHLNRAPDLDTLGDEVFDDHIPYIQTPRLEHGIGEIGFWYRSWGGTANLLVQVSPDGTNHWMTIAEEQVDNTLFQPFSIERHDLTNQFVRIANDTDAPGTARRIAIDEFYVTRPMGADLQLTGATAYTGHPEFPRVPLNTDEPHLEVTLTRFFRAPVVEKVEAFWKDGTDDWAVWPDQNTRSMSLVASNVTQRPFSYTYRTDEPLPIHEIDETVQYRFRATFSGASCEMNRSKYCEDFENPSWHEPVDYNDPAFYGDGTNRTPYYIVFSCPPGAVWINEINAVDNHTYTNEYIELAGRAGVNIENWEIENIDHGNNFVFNHVITNATTLANEINGFGFWVLGDDGVAGVDQVFTNTYGVHDPEQHMARRGGVILRRSMGAYEYRLGYTHSDVTPDAIFNQFEYIGDDAFTTVGSLQLGGVSNTVGNAYTNFTWVHHSGEFTPDAVNINQTLLGDEDSPPWVRTQTPEHIRNRTATLRARLLSTGGSPTDVLIYWGTDDGGTDSTAWDEVIHLEDQSVGMINAPVIGLDPETEYFYRAYATNETSSFWCDIGAQSFTTFADLAISTAAGATDIARESARLRSTLESDAGEPADIRFYWGVSDGEDDPGAWDRAEYFGTVSAGDFSLVVGDLEPNTPYYYRTHATNATGEAWSQTASFTTKAIRYVTADGDGDGADGYTSWGGASSNLAAVVATAADGDLVLVSNGVYRATGVYDYDSYLVLTNGVTVRSVHGAAVTVIDLGDAPQTRGVWMAHSNAVLEGFTVRGGERTDGGTTPEAGGGIYFNPDASGGRVVNAIVTNNIAQDGGGIHLGAASSAAGERALRNALVAGNVATDSGGGIWLGADAALENLTIADNQAGDQGGGLHAAQDAAAAMIVNTILYHNQADGQESNWHHGVTPGYDHALTTPDPGNDPHVLTARPRFADRQAGDYRPAEGSPALDSGTNRAWMVDAVDLAGTNRILNATVSRGAYEAVVYLATRVETLEATDVLGDRATLRGELRGTDGQPTEVFIAWGESEGGEDPGTWDETLSLGVLPVGEFSHLLLGLEAPQEYWYRVYVENPVAGQVWSTNAARFGMTGVRYVKTDGHHIFPYDSWDTAATNIQAAIDTAPLGGQVLVSNGVYTVSTPILLTNAVTVRGVNGPETTHVSGGNATRVFVLGHQNAVIDGLTIRDGWIEGSDWVQDSGGGVWFDPDGSGGTLQNCIVRDNYSENDGGGVYMVGKPSGIWVVRNCVIANNQTDGFGFGGGVFVGDYGIIQNCTVIGNSADWGGGIFVDKDPVDVMIENTLIWHNTAATDDNNYSFDGLPTVLHSSAPGFSAIGSRNIDDSPPFINIGAGNYRLDGSQTNWPGFHGGVVRLWMLHAVDLDGHDRLGVVGGQLFVDVGAYQRMSVNATTAKGTPIAWFQSHGIAIDPGQGETDWNDVDARYNPGKRMTLRQEYLADTDPNDPASLFRIIALERTPRELALTVSVRSERIYTLEYATEPAFTNWAPLPGYHDLQGLPDPLTITNAFGAGSSGLLYRLRVRDLKD